MEPSRFNLEPKWLPIDFLPFRAACYAILGALSDEEKERACCYAVVADGVLWLNYLAFVVFVNNLPGPLAKTLHLRSSFFDAFTDIGSQSAKTFLEAKLKRAASDPAAAHLRSETDGPGNPAALQKWLDDSLKVAVLEQCCEQDKKWQQLALARDERWQLDILARDEHWQQLAAAREEAWCKELSKQGLAHEQWRSRVWEALEAWRADAQRTSEVLGSVVSRLAGLPLALGQKISDVVFAAVMSPGSALIKNLRAATKKTAVRNTHSARRFPASQKATQLEVLSSLISLLSVAICHFPQMTYDTWKAVRCSFGKAVKKARLQRHGLGEASLEYIDRPLLWSFVGEGTAEGGGQRYVHLREHESLVQTVWMARRSIGSGRRRRVESLDEEARRIQAASMARPGYAAEPWPLLSAEVDPDFASSDEEV